MAKGGWDGFMSRTAGKYELALTCEKVFVYFNNDLLLECLHYTFEIYLPLHSLK